MTAKTTSNVKGASSKAHASILNRARTTGWLAVLEAVVVAALGVLLILNPDWILKVAFYVVGVLLMVKGVYKIINYFAVHGRYEFYNNDLLYGVIALIFGILSVVLWEQLSGAIGIVIGAWVIYGALVRMNTAIKLHAAGVKCWFYTLLLSMVMLALGIYMVISVGVVVAIVGWVMIASAVIGVIDDITFLRHVDAVTK